MDEVSYLSLIRFVTGYSEAVVLLILKPLGVDPMCWWESCFSAFYHKTLGSSPTTSLHGCTLAGQEGGFY